MKLEEVAVGHHKVGDFTIVVSPLPYGSSGGEFLSVLVIERGTLPGDLTYVRLASDERFDWFGWIQRFERKMNADDAVEFNHQVSNQFHKYEHPVSVLSRRSIVRLVEVCLVATKKNKKKRLEAKRSA